MKENGNTANQYEVTRRLAQENEALRRKLARHEFRQLERELTSEDPFKLEIHAPSEDVAPDIALPPVEDILLPRLPVPLGSIQRESLVADLPVIAVYDDRLSGNRLAAALMGLLRMQYRAPFARLVFLCSSFEAVPLLGRYGFVVEQVGRADPASFLTRLYRRYGATQIRSVGTGELIAERDGD